ncbi:hypothetical protein M3202_18540 [Alkalihalobacillus oceani]|uniref:Uncharacterized protein n=1 Tax=Halalkalibacter oceani TaxID=1653776 RepID=A0A9X2DSD0_9BACI|nr:hypothetical protein [Halalkalibacter oceani]MCM3716054.1 hypothetical protein [Halalkalibacter oceani]
MQLTIKRFLLELLFVICLLALFLPLFIIPWAFEKTIDWFNGKETIVEAKGMKVESYELIKDREKTILLPNEKKLVILHLEKGSSAIFNHEDLFIRKGDENRMIEQAQVYTKTNVEKQKSIVLELEEEVYKRYVKEYTALFHSQPLIE